VREHVIAATVNDAGLDYGVVKAGVARDLFRFPFRLVVPRTAVWTGAQKTNEDDLLDACGPRRGGDVARTFNVNASVRLIPNLAIDAGAVGDHLATGELRSKVIDVSELTPRNANHFMSLPGQTSGQMTADETICASNCDFHYSLLMCLIAARLRPRPATLL
jgi:hypothetical protein